MALLPAALLPEAPLPVVGTVVWVVPFDKASARGCRLGPWFPELTPSPCACAVDSKKEPLFGLPPKVGLTGW